MNDPQNNPVQRLVERVAVEGFRLGHKHDLDEKDEFYTTTRWLAERALAALGLDDEKRAAAFLRREALSELTERSEDVEYE